MSMSHCGSNIGREPSKIRWPRAVAAAYDARRRWSVDPAAVAAVAAVAAAAAESMRPGERACAASAAVVYRSASLSRPQ